MYRVILLLHGMVTGWLIVMVLKFIGRKWLEFTGAKEVSND